MVIDRSALKAAYSVKGPNILGVPGGDLDGRQVIDDVFSIQMPALGATRFQSLIRTSSRTGGVHCHGQPTPGKYQFAVLGSVSLPGRAVRRLPQSELVRFIHD
jgi:hypothetical protein